MVVLATFCGCVLQWVQVPVKCSQPGRLWSFLLAQHDLLLLLQPQIPHERLLQPGAVFRAGNGVHVCVAGGEPGPGVCYAAAGPVSACAE